MTDLGLAFLTGLTTGGLSCLAVQGGLLATSMAQQAEQTIQQRSPTSSGRRRKGEQTHQPGETASERQSPRLVRPIALFLMAKLVAYTMLGFLLGWLGSVLQLTPTMQAFMQVGIGLFMVGTALRMLNVHPFFRYFVIEPPAFVTRYIRRTAKNSADSTLTPLFLGALTVLIPCGVTQVMMAAAIASGDPVQGAAILFAFTLGTSPLFFTLAYLAAQLGKTLEARFVQVGAAIVLVLGLVSINGGLTLMGRPLFSPRLASIRATPVPSQPTAQPFSEPDPLALPLPWKVLTPEELAASADAEQNAPIAVQGNVVTIHVVNGGYEPQVVQAPAGQPLQLKLVTDRTFG